jgi:hypothetical protein
MYRKTLYGIRAFFGLVWLNGGSCELLQNQDFGDWKIWRYMELYLEKLDISTLLTPPITVEQN